ncbi:MAG: exo-alpha-sialidase [Pirellulales bacterium]|nr:exo-alpha-sialidase [Pirellulales bacterium]
MRIIVERGQGVLLAACLLAMSMPALARGAAPDEQQRSAPAIPLAEGVRTRCLEVLRAGIRSGEFWPAMHAAEGLALAGYGGEVRTCLKSKLETDPDDQHRCGLARELVRAGDLSKVAVMLDILAKEDPYAHVHACESLYKCFRTGDGHRLRAAMGRTGNPTLQMMAAAALGRCGSAEAIELLREKLKDENHEVYRIAAWVLGAIGDASDIPRIRKNVERASDPLSRAFCEHALAQLGDRQGREALLGNLRSGDPAVRTYAANSAGESRIVEAADALTALLGDPERDAQIRAAQSLLMLAQPAQPAEADISRDVYPATKQNPRYTEGSIFELNDGTLLYAVTEFVGSTDDHATAQIIARSSTDGGRTWGGPRVLQENVGRQNVMSVTLRRLSLAANGPAPIGMFYLAKHGPDDLDVHLRVSQDEARTFGEPVLITGRPGYHVMNNDRITVLNSGRLLAPIAATESLQKNHFVSYCCLSDDGGKTWRYGRGQVDLPQRGAMEPEVVELLDGRILMIARNQLGTVSAAWSEDGGDTWSPPGELPGVRAPEAPATLRRIPATGDLLLVWNNTYTPGTGHGGSRTPLAAAISRDDGRTWQNVRNLESRRDNTYAYTSLIFVQDRAVLSYYVADAKTGLHSSRFRCLPIAWFYSQGETAPAD